MEQPGKGGKEECKRVTPVEELALRLYVGARAIRAGRVQASYAELVDGALESIRAEHLLPDHWGGGKQAARRAQGLCVYCGKRPATPGYRICAVCLLKTRATRARRRGEIPIIEHERGKSA